MNGNMTNDPPAALTFSKGLPSLCLGVNPKT